MESVWKSSWAGTVTRALVGELVIVVLLPLAPHGQAGGIAASLNPTELLRDFIRAG